VAVESQARTMRYLIVIEQTVTGFSAYSPDVPGCIATGDTRDEAEREMKGAIAFHLGGLKAEGMPIPQPSSSSSYVEIPA
jgi:predicted RNase H-like HicB family nuclease